MKTIFKSSQNGFAIIEALIAFLVFGIAAAALLYLQGNLMSGSSLSKAQAEAMELAKDRTEVLRNYINRRQFLSALRIKKTSLDSDQEQGVNALYTVCYAGIPTVPNEPLTTVQIIQFLKNPVSLEVTVKWPGVEGDTVTCSTDSAKDETVTLETKLYFMSPIIASGIVTGKEGGDDFFPLISPFITGVEKEHNSTALQTLTGTVDDDHRVMNVDIDGNITFSNTDIAIKTYIDSSTGHSNVEVVVNGVVKLTSFGGIVHKIQGDIIVDEGANSTLSDLTKKKSKLLGLFASPPSYCLFSICEVGDDSDPTTDVCEKSNGAEFARYVCYVPGDCTYGVTAGYVVSTPPDFSNPGCPSVFTPPPGRDDLNGGWYGRVGNYHLEVPQDKVCAANTDTVSWKTSSREYVTYRWETCDISKPSCTITPYISTNEGINTPYKDQTFLIVNKNAVCANEIVGTGSNLVHDHIERNLVGEKRPMTDELVIDPSMDNVVLPENECVTGGACP